MRAQSEGSGDGGALMLGTVQIRPNSERLLVDGIALTRGTDYSVDYDLGRVSFNRPDTLFPRPRQVTVQYEENPVFEETPTSIFGATAEIPFANVELNFTAISQSQHTNFTRPPLGFEPAASPVAGVSALFNFDAEPLTQLVSRLPFGPTTVPSQFAFSVEFAASRPQTSVSQQAYLESFEGEGGLPISLADPAWYFSSQPALGINIPARFGATVFDLSRATTLVWQSNGLDADGHAVSYTIDKIDTAVAQSGAGSAAPEPLLWLTLYPDSIAGHLNPATNAFRWTVPNATPGRRCRSVRTVLNPSGADIRSAAPRPDVPRGLRSSADSRRFADELHRPQQSPRRRRHRRRQRSQPHHSRARPGAVAALRRQSCGPDEVHTTGRMQPAETARGPANGSARQRVLGLLPHPVQIARRLSGASFAAACQGTSHHDDFRRRGRRRRVHHRSPGATSPHRRTLAQGQRQDAARN